MSAIQYKRDIGIIDQTAGISPSFMVGNVPVFGDLILSPMDGYSDSPYRRLARSLGSAMSYTEFINAIDVVGRHPHLEEHLIFEEEERPLVLQVFDEDPDRLVRAVTKLRRRNPDIIDINMGCSAKCVSNRGAGAGLLKTPEKIAEIFRRLTHELDIPVTGKIRLGWDDESRNYLDVAKIIEDNGGKLIAVHGRTRVQAYSGQADWDAIAQVKQTVGIPVIGNGDVKTVADIDRMKKHTGCDAVMIGRAAISNPWIFSRLDRDQVSPEMVHKTILEQLGRMQTFYGPKKGLILLRKFATRFLQPYSLAVEMRQCLLTADNKDEFQNLLREIFQNQLLITPSI